MISHQERQHRIQPSVQIIFSFKALIHNCNEMSYQTDLDQYGDKTTMGHSDNA